MKVLVTGAGGFIGSHLCDRLVERGYDVKAFVRYNSRNHWGWLEDSAYKNKMQIVCGDIRNYDSVKDAAMDTKIIFHLAALIGIPYSYHSADAYVDTNVKGTLNILQAARELDIQRIVHTSTSEIYGRAQNFPISEASPSDPHSPYAATKAAADFMAISFYRSFNLPVALIRPFNTYGPRQSARAIIPTIITQILSKNKKIKLGSLFPTRDLTYVKDTVEGFIKAAESEKSIGEVINLGTSTEISIKDLAFLIAELMGVKIEIETDTQRTRPEKSEVGRLRADTHKADKFLGWTAKYSLQDGLKETIDWLKENSRSYKPHLYNV